MIQLAATAGDGVHTPRIGRHRAESDYTYAMRLHQPVSTHYPVRRRRSGVNGQSREGLVEKLNDARCKWMITLHHYSSETYRGNLDHDAWRNTSTLRSSVPGPGASMVPAADFCPECGSIVPVDLECSMGREFIAEHRWGCSVCESGQRACVASTNKTSARGSRRVAGTNCRRFLDQDWRLWEVMKHAYQNSSPRPVVFDSMHLHTYQNDNLAREET